MCKSYSPFRQFFPVLMTFKRWRSVRILPQAASPARHRSIRIFRMVSRINTKALLVVMFQTLAETMIYNIDSSDYLYSSDQNVFEGRRWLQIHRETLYLYRKRRLFAGQLLVFLFFFWHRKFVFLACCCNLYIAEPMFDGLNKKLIDHRKARENFNY